MSTYNIYLRNFRVVKEANIKLNGITVLVGHNSSGKGTVSTFFYHFMESLMGLEEKARRGLIFFIEKCKRSIRRISFREEFDINSERVKFRFSVSESLEKIQEILYNKGEDIESSIDRECNTLREGLLELFRFMEQKQRLEILDELNSVLSREESKELEKYIYVSHVNGIVNLLLKFLEEKYKKHKEILEERPEEFVLNIVRQALYGEIQESNYIYRKTLFL